MRRPPINIPLLGLDLHTPDHAAADGTLRVLENLCYVGPPEHPYLSPVEVPLETGQAEETIVGRTEYVRSANGTETRLGILVTSSKVYWLDPNAPASQPPNLLFTFDEEDETRRVQFAQVGSALFLAVSTGLGAFAEPTGKPEMLLVIMDIDPGPGPNGEPPSGTQLACVEYNIPPLPVLGAEMLSTSDADALDAGYYAYRYAYQFRDGSFGPMSRPYVLDFTSLPENSRASVRWVLISHTLPLPPAWQYLISGIAIFMTPKTLAAAAGEESYIDTLMNSPFYHVTTMPGVEAGAQVTWSQASTAIESNPAAEDDNLLRHRILAASAFSYNRRLILGDVAYDFRAPAAPFDIDSPGTEPPVIWTDYPGTAEFKDGGGESVYYYVQSLQRNIASINAALSGFIVTIHSWDEDTSTWVAWAPGSYKKARITLTDDGLNEGLPPGATNYYYFIIEAEDVAGLSVTQSFSVAVYGA